MSWRGIDSNNYSSDDDYFSEEDIVYVPPPPLWEERHYKIAFSFSRQDPELARMHANMVLVVPSPNGFMARVGDFLLAIDICGKTKTVFGAEATSNSPCFEKKEPLFSWSLSAKHALEFRVKKTLELWPREWHTPWTLLSLAILMAAFDRGTFAAVRQLASAIETAQGVRAPAFPGRSWAPWEQLARVQSNRSLWKNRD